MNTIVNRVEAVQSHYDEVLLNRTRILSAITNLKLHYFEELTILAQDLLFVNDQLKNHDNKHADFHKLT